MHRKLPGLEFAHSIRVRCWRRLHRSVFEGYGSGVAIGISDAYSGVNSQGVARIEVACICEVGFAFDVLGILNAEDFVCLIGFFCPSMDENAYRRLPAISAEARNVLTDGCITNELRVAVGMRRLVL